jgi:spermidine/putrescine ABC transporter ATP-binding subunit
VSSVTTRAVSKRYGTTIALNPLDLAIRDGEFLTLLGPSGCGKTTTLRLLAGFIRPSEGAILFGDEDVTAMPPQRRQIGMVFQDYALFPHMTIAENIGFGLVERRRPTREVKDRVTELLHLIKLPDVGQRYPSELSGGQQQRVAVARAVAHAPRVLLMDEPLGALDLKLREAMQTEIRRIQQDLKITTVYVTHDQTEAMTMSDRIAVMNAGRLEQIGSAADIYDRPRSSFVASFVGQINLLAATVHGMQDGNLVATMVGQTVRAPPGDSCGSGTFLIGIRPEQLSILAPLATPPPGSNVLPGTLVSRQFSGNVIRLIVDVGASAPLMVDSHPNAPSPATGEPVTVIWQPNCSVALSA